MKKHFGKACKIQSICHDVLQFYHLSQWRLRAAQQTKKKQAGAISTFLCSKQSLTFKPHIEGLPGIDCGSKLTKDYTADRPLGQQNQYLEVIISIFPCFCHPRSLLLRSNFSLTSFNSEKNKLSRTKLVMDSVKCMQNQLRGDNLTPANYLDNIKIV